MLSRIATFPFTNGMIADNMRLQVKYADVNTQIATGLKSQDYKGIARDAQRLLGIESAKSQLEGYIENGKLIQQEMNIMYDAVGRMVDLSNSMLQGLTAALGGNFVDPAVTTSQAQIGMNEMAGLLNLQAAGRHLFAGSDIDTTPVDLTDPLWVAQVPPSVPDTNYYQGNSTILAVQLSETYTVSYGFLANNSAFEEILRAYNLIVNNPGSQTAYQEASGLLQSGIDGMANIMGQMSSISLSIEEQTLRNEEDIVNLKELITSLKEVDLPTASVEMTEVQTQMEAAYSASIKVLQMSLTNYI
jgi:flagellar hook-associated protein 3 FlgL